MFDFERIPRQLSTIIWGWGGGGGGKSQGVEVGGELGNWST